MLKRMPAARRMGNMGIGFMVKTASGYWNISDPVNGFFAIRTSTLRQMEFARIADRFFFESSMLIEMHYTGARIHEVSMPAIYGNEKAPKLPFRFDIWYLPMGTLRQPRPTRPHRHHHGGSTAFHIRLSDAVGSSTIRHFLPQPLLQTIKKVKIEIS